MPRQRANDVREMACLTRGPVGSNLCAFLQRVEALSCLTLVLRKESLWHSIEAPVEFHLPDLHVLETAGQWQFG